MFDETIPPTASSAPPTLFTIGHSNHTLETFLQLLHDHQIEVLVDVRSQPYSRYSPHFNKQPLKEGIVASGLKYLFLGQALGGRPEGAEFYDEEGYVLYWRVAESPPFLKGIARLERGIENFRVAMMCSEENPAICHRHLLVGRVLTGRGVVVQHIRGDSRVQTNEEVLAGDTRPDAPQQLSLFALEPVLQERPWKSLQSVLPKNQPKSSLES